MTCSEGAMDWIRMMGWLGSYVPGTANSRSRHIKSFGDTYCSSKEVSCQNQKKYNPPEFQLNLTETSEEFMLPSDLQQFSHQYFRCLQQVLHKHQTCSKSYADTSRVLNLNVLNNQKTWNKISIDNLHCKTHNRTVLLPPPEAAALRYAGTHGNRDPKPELGLWHFLISCTFCTIPELPLDLCHRPREEVKNNRRKTFLQTIVEQLETT